MAETPASPNTRPKRPISKPGRVSYNTEEFANAIEDQGVMVRITPTMLCPNRTSIEDTNHVLDCPICFGEETLEIPEAATEDWALIQGIKVDKQFQMQGIYDLKDAMLTTKPGTRIFYWYKVEILDFASIFNELVKRQSDDTDKLRYNLADAPDHATFCIDKAGVRYVKGTDFTITERILTWTGVSRPVDGTVYSITYPILPTFRVMELVNENRYYYNDFKSHVKTPVQLPQRCMVRWDYLAKRSGQGETREENGNPPEVTPVEPPTL